MSIYAAPALIALLIKVGIIVLALRGQHTSKLFMSMLGVMALHNASEFLIISALFDGMVSDQLLRSYYVIASFSLAYLCLFCFETAGWCNTNNAKVATLAVAATLAAVSGGSDLIVAGATSLGYTVTAVKGEFYGVFQLYSIGTVALAAFALLNGLLPNRSEPTQIRSSLILFAVAPIVVTTIGIIVAMNLGAGFTGAILMPVATSLFLYIALRTERGHHVVDVRRFLPFSAERVTLREINRVAKEHLDGIRDFKATKDDVDRILIEHALKVEEQNVTWAARRLGIHRTSFYSMLKKLGLETQRSNSKQP